jgi:hypothetical protein
MTLDDFRRIALSMPGTIESNRMGYASFRVEGKGFATIEESTAIIRLTREQQATLMASAPQMFAPVPGGWGRLGSTVIRLEVADEAKVRAAVATAWGNVADVRADAQSIADALEIAAASVANVAADRPDVPEVVAAVEDDSAIKVADAAGGDQRDPPHDELQSAIQRLQGYWKSGRP